MYSRSNTCQISGLQTGRRGRKRKLALRRIAATAVTRCRVQACRAVAITFNTGYRDGPRSGHSPKSGWPRRFVDAVPVAAGKHRTSPLRHPEPLTH